MYLNIYVFPIFSIIATVRNILKLPGVCMCVCVCVVQFQLAYIYSLC